MVGSPVHLEGLVVVFVVVVYAVAVYLGVVLPPRMNNHSLSRGGHHGTRICLLLLLLFLPIGPITDVVGFPKHDKQTFLLDHNQ